MKGIWFSKIDIDTKNLKVKKNQALPGLWQAIAKVKYLKEKYGKDEFFFQEQDNLVIRNKPGPK